MRPFNVLIIIVFCSVVSPAFAQWSRTSPNTYLTTSTDNVGIGTQTPKSKLDVYTVLPALGNYDMQYWSTDNPAYNLKLRATWSNSYGITQEFIQRSSGTEYPVLSFYAGRVGIGTSAPGARLDVSYALPSQGTHDIQYWTVGNPSFFLKLQSVWNNSGITQKFVQRFSGVDYPVLSFYMGNVGIGIDNPGVIDAKLAVKGLIHTQEVKVDLLGAIAPDYVFEKDFKLLPLEQLELYITQNKHLPEVPSAKTMEENGILLKEMNLILLKKVEELTLYILEQEKKTIEQEKRISALEEKLTKN